VAVALLACALGSLTGAAAPESKVRRGSWGGAKPAEPAAPDPAAKPAGDEPAEEPAAPAEEPAAEEPVEEPAEEPSRPEANSSRA
jgi:hypothetical protein